MIHYQEPVNKALIIVAIGIQTKGETIMAIYSERTFSSYLLNFQENYRFFSLIYTGKNLDLFLNQFVNDQINMAQSVYGDYYAEQARLFAERLPYLPKEAKAA